MTNDELDAIEARAKVWAPDTSVASDLARDVLALVADVRRLCDYDTLAKHHRECERLGERMALLLGRTLHHPDPPEVMRALRDWEAHQWPPVTRP